MDSTSSFDSAPFDLSSGRRQNKSPQATDEDIVSNVQKGDLEAFGVLVSRYEAKMLRYGYKFLSQYEDRQDVVQEVFIKAYENIKSFDISQKFSPWIYRIAHNTFINYIKKRQREPMTFFDPDTFFARDVHDESIEDKRKQAEIREILDQTLAKIDPKYREVLVLYYFEEKDYKEIAEILHVPISTVGVRLRRGKKIMRSIYKQR
jgi:RNA polymerase sigma-70 factor, ECF subfamily